MEPFGWKNRLLYESIRRGVYWMIDELLFRKAAKGDKECFIKLLEPIRDSLYKVAFVYLKNEDDALYCIQ